MPAQSQVRYVPSRRAAPAHFSTIGTRSASRAAVRRGSARRSRWGSGAGDRRSLLQRTQHRRGISRCQPTEHVVDWCSHRRAPATAPTARGSAGTARRREPWVRQATTFSRRISSDGERSSPFLRVPDVNQTGNARPLTSSGSRPRHHVRRGSSIARRQRLVSGVVARRQSNCCSDPIRGGRRPIADLCKKSMGPGRDESPVPEHD